MGAPLFTASFANLAKGAASRFAPCHKLRHMAHRHTAPRYGRSSYCGQSLFIADEDMRARALLQGLTRPLHPAVARATPMGANGAGLPMWVLRYLPQTLQILQRLGSPSLPSLGAGRIGRRAFCVLEVVLWGGGGGGFWGCEWQG